MHKTVQAFHKAGIIHTFTMREFDSLCLPEVPVFNAKKIKALGAREKVSQSVFSYFLNVSPSTVKKWEAGDMCPSGAAVRLLDIIDY